MGRDSQTGSWPGVFIAVEGIDGSGKSTVATAVVRRLRKELDREVILTREPGGTPLGEGVRDLVLSAASAGITPVAELLLFSAARAQHVSAVIEPHLRAGSIIVCDRFTDSTLAYQWGGRGLPRDTIAAAQAVATGGVAPDLRVLLDLPVTVALGRRHAESESVNRFDAEHVAFHQSVRNAYLQLVAEHPNQWLVIDADCSQEDAVETTYRSLLAWLTACDGRRLAGRA
ncbi:MAG: dTMP kinase [Thermomicrobiales bacterium]|nr:dTMP kinase [Thermomicrobiales bacterium]MCA9879162.1 dTMP kinase [Thermomicrobiales bacterium]